MNRLLAFLLFVPSLLMAQVPDHVPTEGLVAWYPFYQSLEEVVGGHDGQSDSPTFETGGGLFLQTGDSPVNLPQSLEINEMDGSLTLGGWIRLDDSDMVWRVVMDLTDGDEDNSWTNRATLSMEKVQGELRWVTGLKTGDDMANNISRVLSLPDPDIVGLWRHVMAVWDVQDVVKIYVNGSPLDGSLDISDAANFNLVGGQPGSRRIGGRAHNTNQDRLWHGAMKDIGVWGRALSATEIQSLALVTQQPGCTDPDACNFNPTATQDDGSCLSPPVIDLGEDIETCEDSVILDAGDGFGSYLWNTGETSQSITVSESGPYEATVSSHPANEGSLSFDGDDDWVEAETIDLTGHPFNIEGWLRVPSVSHAHVTNVIDNYVFGSGGSDRWGVYVGGLEDDDMGFEWRGQLYAPTFGIPPTSGGLRIDDNQWHHFAVQRGSDGMASIYIDGVLNGVGNCPLAYNLNAGFPTRINGGFHCEGGQQCRFMACQIAEIQVSLDEKYTSDFEPPCQIVTSSNAVLHYRFGNTNGDTALDLSGSENHGAIHGASWSEEVPFQNCHSCESSDEILVDFDDCDGYCGEGTIWDNAIQQCVSIVEPCIPACAEGTVWNDDIQGCICSNDEPESNSDCECPTQPELDGFISYGSFEGSHYYFHPESMSWAMADSLSSLNGGHLVTIGSQQEQDHLETLLGWSTDAHWIGLYQNLSSAVYQEPSGGWEWVTGEPLDYDNWRIGEPNESTPGEDFGSYIPAEGWNDGHNGDVPQIGTPWTFIMEVPCCAEICNDPTACGPGTVWDPVNEQCIVAIPTDTDFDGCVTAGDVLNLLATFGTCPPLPFSGPCQGLDHVTYQGHDYDIVAIGEQCWFAENLQAESYRNGDEIQSELSDADWSSMSGATSVYGEGTSDCENFAPDGDACAGDWPLVQYGRLYNWHTVDDARELCPSGWHVPTVSNWMDLTDHLDSLGQSGVLMKTSTGWVNNGGGSNDSGFSGQPTGYRSGDGSFQNAGKRGYWWSQTPYSLENNSLAHYIRLVEAQDDVDHFYDETHLGFAVRCIKD